MRIFEDDQKEIKKELDHSKNDSKSAEDEEKELVWIKETLPKGTLKLQFNETVKIPQFLNVSNLNGTNLDIYIIPSNNRHHDNGFNLSKLNLTWQAESLLDNILQI